MAAQTPVSQTDATVGRLQGQHLPLTQALQIVEIFTISGTSTSHPVLRDRGKDAMEMDDNDLGHLTHDLELDDVADDLPHSRLMLDDHILDLEENEMQEDLLHSFAFTPESPAKKINLIFLHQYHQPRQSN